MRIYFRLDCHLSVLIIVLMKARVRANTHERRHAWEQTRERECACESRHAREQRAREGTQTSRHVQERHVRE